MKDYKALEAPAAGSSKHTPGPWSVCYHWKHPDCPCGTHRGFIWAPDGERVIAQLGCDTDEGGQTYPSPAKAEARANALLIAAAPALADALEALVERLDGDRHFVNPDGGAEMLVAAEVALRAAGRLP